MTIRKHPKRISEVLKGDVPSQDGKLSLAVLRAGYAVMRHTLR